MPAEAGLGSARGRRGHHLNADERLGERSLTGCSATGARRKIQSLLLLTGTPHEARFRFVLPHSPLRPDLFSRMRCGEHVPAVATLLSEQQSDGHGLTSNRVFLRHVESRDPFGDANGFYDTLSFLLWTGLFPRLDGAATARMLVLIRFKLAASSMRGRTRSPTPRALGLSERVRAFSRRPRRMRISTKRPAEEATPARSSWS